ncbi:MAG TPA: carbon-nitrogen hydrolase family protein [Solirubrobacterales bacterium]|nr:carbon-nitrogen hydrolase family protein [Solirubrobacterales bacterium]
MRALSLAALQTAPVPRDPEATLGLLARRVRSLRTTVPHAQLAVLPELHLSAPPSTLEEHSGYAREVAVEIPGPLTEALGRIAAESEIWLVPGSVYELASDGRVHNTAVVLAPDGELVASYRKVFPWQPHETCAPGEEFVTFDIPEVGRVGLAICYDGSFPETFRQLAWMGAELILQVNLTTTSDREQELVMARANAIFNQLYVVSLNAASPAGVGRSLIADPEGLVRVASGAGEEMLTDVLDLEAVERVRRFGTAGVSRMWEQMMREGPGIELPMYGGPVREPAA